MVIVAIIDKFSGLNPNSGRFTEKIIQVVVISYIISMLYFEFCVKLLMGTDLDRSLSEKKIAWSLLDIRLVAACTSQCFHGGINAVKIMIQSSGDDVERNRLLNKYLSMTMEELNIEIALLKAAMADTRSELECVENVKYTLDDHLWTVFSVKLPKK